MSTRDQILEIAYRAFAEKGYNHTSMGAIAEELGITRPALYYHFSSKEDLLLATYEMIDPLINVSADEALGCTEPAEFKQAFAALIASITSNLRNDEQRARFVATVESTSAQYDETCAIFATALEHGKAIGAVSADMDIDAAKQYLGIFIYGIGDIMLRGCKINMKATRDMALKAIFG